MDGEWQNSAAQRTRGLASGAHKRGLLFSSMTNILRNDRLLPLKL